MARAWLAVGGLVIAGCTFERPADVGDDAIDAATDAPGVDALPPRDVAVAIGADFSAPAVMGAVDIETMVLTPDVVPTGLAPDPVVRQLGDELFVVNRLIGGSVIVLDPDDFSTRFSAVIGAGTNPQDVAQVGDKLFVPALGTAGVRVVDRSDPGTIRQIDLSALDPDGQPDCVSAFAVGDEVVVACGLLDANFLPRGVGKLVYLDADTELMTGTRDMPVPNPLGLLRPTPVGGPLGGDLLIGTFDGTAPDDGCVARVPRGTGNSTCLLTNLEIGGTVNGIAVTTNGATIWFAAGGRLRGYDVLGDQLAAPVTPAAQQLSDVAVCTDETVVVADRGSSPGVRLYRADVEITPDPLDLGLPPGYGGSLACFEN